MTSERERNRDRIDPDTVRAWQRIVRDFVIICLGAFLFVFGTLRVNDPTVLALMYGAGLTLLGVPAALRLDERRKEDE